MEAELIFNHLKCGKHLPSGKLTLLLKMAIEIVDFPMKNCDFPQFFVSLPEGSWFMKLMFLP